MAAPAVETRQLPKRTPPGNQSGPPKKPSWDGHELQVRNECRQSLFQRDRSGYSWGAGFA
jgi:hypothetical protein